MPPSPFRPSIIQYAKVTTAASTTHVVATSTPGSVVRNAATSATTASRTVTEKSIANAKLKSFRQIVQSRVSARRFQPNANVPDVIWKDILRMTMTSPSGFNLQPTHIILLRSPTLKSTLSKHAMLGFGNQYRTTDASGIAVFCSDLEPSKRIDRIYEMERSEGGRADGYLAVLRVAASFLTGESSTSSNGGGGVGGGRSGSSTRLSTILKQTFTHALSPIQPMPTMENVESWSYKNAGIIAQQYTLASTAHGLSTCMMEGYDARRVKEILRIPDRYGVPLMVATGYDYDTMEGGKEVVHADLDEDGRSAEGDDDDDGVGPTERTPRLEMNELFFGDTFGEPLDFLLDDAPFEKEVVA